MGQNSPLSDNFCIILWHQRKDMFSISDCKYLAYISTTWTPRNSVRNPSHMFSPGKSNTKVKLTGFQNQTTAQHQHGPGRECSRSMSGKSWEITMKIFYAGIRILRKNLGLQIRSIPSPESFSSSYIVFGLSIVVVVRVRIWEEVCVYASMSPFGQKPRDCWLCWRVKDCVQSWGRSFSFDGRKTLRNSVLRIIYIYSQNKRRVGFQTKGEEEVREGGLRRESFIHENFLGPSDADVVWAEGKEHFPPTQNRNLAKKRSQTSSWLRFRQVTGHFVLVVLSWNALGWMLEQARAFYPVLVSESYFKQNTRIL